MMIQSILSICYEVFEKLKITKEETDFLEKATRSHYFGTTIKKDDLQHHVSRHIIIMSTLRTYPMSIVKKILHYEAIFHL